MFFGHFYRKLFVCFSKDCTANDADSSEPMIGLNELVLGGAYAALQEYSLAINAYRKCIAKRINILNQDMHITAFAHYELATLLIHCHKQESLHLHTLHLNKLFSIFCTYFRTSNCNMRRKNCCRKLKNAKIMI